MPVENALILAAGKGTRMGKIGEKLPKVLWPIFEKSILEMEVAYARELGAKKIFINTHYYTEELKRVIKNNESFSDVELLIETAPIDIGGAVHNLARKLDYCGELLVLNSDQFIMLDPSSWQKALATFKKCDALLFAYEVTKEDMYNALWAKNDQLLGIKKNEEFGPGEKMLTYTGMSLIKLGLLEKRAGKSKFFESVADPSKLNVRVQSIDSSPYWDFGTLERYWNSCFRVLECLATNKKGPFIEFLIRQKALIVNKAHGTSYGATGDHVINLANDASEKLKNKIILKSSDEDVSSDEGQIIYGNIAQDIA